jgi:Sec-independent protein secretion pathway component TatC
MQYHVPCFPLMLSIILLITPADIVEATSSMTTVAVLSKLVLRRMVQYQTPICIVLKSQNGRLSGVERVWREKLRWLCSMAVLYKDILHIYSCRFLFL